MKLLEHQTIRSWISGDLALHSLAGSGVSHSSEEQSGNQTKKQQRQYWVCGPKLSGCNRFTLSRQLHRWNQGKRQLNRKQSRWLGTQHWNASRCSTCVPTECIFCSPALSTTRRAVSTTNNTKHWIMLWSTRKGTRGRVSPNTFWGSDRWQRLPARACLPSSETFWIGTTKHS